MITTLRLEREITDSRTWLKAQGLDVTDPDRLRVWRLLYSLRFLTRAPKIDLIKSWDVAHVLDLIGRHCPDRRSAILDMGCFNSEILCALYRAGYTSLRGCDLDPRCRWMPYWHRIQYREADLTRTLFPDASFSAITCISVIELGVPVPRFVEEVHRLLKIGGIVIVTTDFDGTGEPHAIPEHARVCGHPWTIMDRPGLESLVDRFLRAGFSPLDSAQHEIHADRPIHWNGHTYTFALVAMKKTG